jgi:hypothetical protein
MRNMKILKMSLNKLRHKTGKLKKTYQLTIPKSQEKVSQSNNVNCEL